MFIKLQYNERIRQWIIPTATDGTVGRLDDNYPATRYFSPINPPHPNIMPLYNGIIYALPIGKDPFSRHPFDNTLSYWIKV